MCWRCDHRGDKASLWKVADPRIQDVERPSPLLSTKDAERRAASACGRCRRVLRHRHPLRHGQGERAIALGLW
jgi:hypothetical protein